MRIVSLPTSGTSDVGPDVVEDPLERAEVVDRARDAPLLRLPPHGQSVR